MKYVLSIETSCDDTSVAIVDENRKVICSLVTSQDSLHKVFGGVVPEIASRNHTIHLLPMVEKALTCIPHKHKSPSKASIWSNIMGVAATSKPGLVGSLIVGLVTAKTLALAHNKPFLGIHHIEGHIMSAFLIDEKYKGPDFFNGNFIALVVSGGHTQLYHVKGFGSYTSLGETSDDAAGEAFDKFAKTLGLAYPGGVQVDCLAQKGNPEAYHFPRPLIKEDNFSFSGLKSSAQRLLHKMSEQDKKNHLEDLCASYQQAIIDVLITKLERAINKTEVKHFVVTGGVSANSGLRKAVQEVAKRTGTQLALPPLRYCTDNGAMIGLAALLRLQKGENSSQDLAPQPRAPL